MNVLLPSQTQSLNLLPSALHVYQFPFRRGTLNPGALQLPAETRITSVSTGFFFALCVDDNGKLFSFGINGDFERLGHGPTGATAAINPTPVSLPPEAFIVDASAGGNHSIALCSDGIVYSFGADDYAQLGRLNSSPYPRPVPLKGKVRSVHCGWNFSVAVLDDNPGKIITWGSGKDGQLGHTHFHTSARPNFVDLHGDVKFLAAGYSHVAAIVKTTQPDSPESRSTCRAVIWGSAGVALLDPHVIHSVPGLPADQVVSLSAGKMFTLFLTNKGIVYAIGSGEEGQLGVGDLCGRNNATVVGGLLPHRIVRIAAGTVSAVAMTDEGTFFRWGNGQPDPEEMYVHIPEMALRFPFTHTLKLSAGAGDLLLAGAAASSGDSGYIPQRPIREFLRQFFEDDSSVLASRCKRTHVYHHCSHKASENAEGECEDCYLIGYAPLLSIVSEPLKEALVESDGLFLDLKKFSRNGVYSFVHYATSGFMSSDTSIEAAQEVAAISLKFEASELTKYASKYIQRKLTRKLRPGLVLSALRDDDDAEESHVRAALRKVSNSSDSIRIVLKKSNKGYELVGTIDRVVLCAYSSKYRAWLQSSSTKSMEWVVEIPNDSFTDNFFQIAARGLRIWFTSRKSEDWMWKFNEECSRDFISSKSLIEPLAAVVLASHVTGIESLRRIAENELVVRISSNMRFKVWAGLLCFASNWPGMCPRVLAKITHVGDKACSEVERKEEVRIIEELEKEARKTKTTWDAETARIRRRGLARWNRDKVYCNTDLGADYTIKVVKQVFWSNSEPGENLPWSLNGEGVRNRTKRYRKHWFSRRIKLSVLS